MKPVCQYARALQNHAQTHLLICKMSRDQAIGDAPDGFASSNHSHGSVREWTHQERADIEFIVPCGRPLEMGAKIPSPPLVIGQRVTAPEGVPQEFCGTEGKVHAFRCNGVDEACGIAEKRPIAAASALAEQSPASEARYASRKEPALAGRNAWVAR